MVEAPGQEGQPQGRLAQSVAQPALHQLDQGVAAQVVAGVGGCGEEEEKRVE